MSTADPFVVPSAPAARIAPPFDANAELTKRVASLERLAGAAFDVGNAAVAYKQRLARRDPHMAELERQRLEVLVIRLTERLLRADVVELLKNTPEIGPRP